MVALIPFLLLVFFPWGLSMASEEKPMGYEVSIEGVKEKSLKEELLHHSLLKNLDKSKIRSKIAFTKRIQKDTETFKKILDSKGYYDHTLRVEQMEEKVQKESKGNSKAQVKEMISFHVYLGSRYKVESFNLKLNSENIAQECGINLKEAGFDRGSAVDASEILKIFDKIKGQLANCGYPFAELTSHRVFLDKEKKTVAVHVIMTPGVKTHFGSVHVLETGGVPKSYILNRIPWKEGELYSQKKVDAFRTLLTQTRLFGSIIINTNKANLAGHKLSVKVTLKKGKPRTLWAGALYSTGEGYGAKLGWTHRNITEKADRFRSSVEYGKLKSLLDLEYEVPDFMSPQQSFLTSLEILRQKTESYRTLSYGISGRLSRPLTETLTLNYGLFYSRERVTERGKTLHLSLFGFPLGVSWDTQDDILNPTKGWVLSPEVTPKVGRIGSQSFLTHSTVYGSTYWALTESKDSILALRGRLTSVLGGDIKNMPATQRVYMGGSNSIRGYQFQLAGPVDGTGKPLGGKSSWEIGIEPRIKLTPKWGFVVFYEAGVLSDKGFGGTLLHGVGLGLRYYTDFGPLRADIAFPLKKRRKSDGKPVDAPFQFYISIGQSF